MSRLGTKLRRLTTSLAHWCPACKRMHVFAVESPFRNGAQWKWDGNVELPTFTPSMNIRTNPPEDPHYQPQAMSSVCHYFLTKGVIQFLGDCTHAMKGQHVPLPELPTETERD